MLQQPAFDDPRLRRGRPLASPFPFTSPPTSPTCHDLHPPITIINHSFSPTPLNPAPQFKVKMVTSDDEKTTDIVVQGDEEEIERMRRELGLVRVMLYFGGGGRGVCGKRWVDCVRRERLGGWCAACAAICCVGCSVVCGVGLGSKVKCWRVSICRVGKEGLRAVLGMLCRAATPPLKPLPCRPVCVCADGEGQGVRARHPGGAQPVVKREGARHHRAAE